MSAVTDIQEQVRQAADNGTPVHVQGNNTRSFYGHAVDGDAVSTRNHTGIIDYTPAELVISVRAGTPLHEVERVLAAEGQCLPFEPPAFGATATIGGTVATGLSGPARPWRGAVRDYVLGVNCINGLGQYLRFGGQVMKNVAGYDLSRLLTGSFGTLAVILDIHLKVLPRSETELTLGRECSAAEGIRLCADWSARPIPLSAACHDGQRLRYRLSGSDQGVRAAQQEIGGDTEPDNDYWTGLREHTLPFFAGDAPLWRIAVAPATAPLGFDEATLTDWGGAQRWVRSERPADELRAAIAVDEGHATLFRHAAPDAAVFSPLQPGIAALHTRLKQAFDPHGILNPGRMYPQA